MRAEFAGKVALVTGGAAGIGSAICRRLAAGGAAVIVTDRHAAGALALASEIGAHAEALDVTDADAVAACVDHIVSRFGGLHLAVNNAGVGDPLVATADKSVKDWRRVMSINLDSIFYCLKAEIPALLASGGGAIVNVASVLGRNAFPGAAAYVAAKHGVIGLTKAAAIDYAGQGLRINAVAPAFIGTDNLRGARDAAAIDALVARHPIGRLGTPEEVAEITAFLLSDRASFVTGSCHLIDGGYDAV